MGSDNPVFEGMDTAQGVQDTSLPYTIDKLLPHFLSIFILPPQAFE